jgi:hypothetical protein
MIKNRNIDRSAAIDLSKIQGMGASGPFMGEIHYVAKAGTQPRTWLDSRVPGDTLHKTLDAALAACVASRGDTIFITPYHTETITGAGGITLDKIGVSIRGLGRYDARPSFLMDGAACSMLVTAADMSMENCVFNSGHADLAYFAHVTGKGFHFLNNFVGENVAEENFVIGISAGTADNDHDGLVVAGNNFVGVDTAATGCIVLNKDNLDVRIIGNTIVGNFGTTPFAPILMPDDEIPLNIEIAHNVIHNQHNADAVVGISVLEAVGTGTMHHNLVYGLDVAGATPFLAGATGLACFENYYIFEGTTSAYLMPTKGIPA